MDSTTLLQPRPDVSRTAQTLNLQRNTATFVFYQDQHPLLTSELSLQSLKINLCQSLVFGRHWAYSSIMINLTLCFQISQCAVISAVTCLRHLWIKLTNQSVSSPSGSQKSFDLYLFRINLPPTIISIVQFRS